MKYPKIAIVGLSFALCVAGAVFVSGIFRVPVAHAADCGITAADISQITAIQNDPSLSYSDEIKQELAVRKNLIGKTIVCAQQEVQTFQTSLASSSVDSADQDLQSQLAGRLNDASNFYTIELANLNGAGIVGSEEIAQQVLAWRQGTFIPLSEGINNFILWSGNQDLFDTAQTRMSQTQNAVSFLECTSPNPELQSAFDAASVSFSNAQNENAEAKAALAQGLSPDQTLALIKQSLDSLSTTYQNFFTIGTLIKTILPQ